MTARPAETCPLTGLPARYLDPETNVSFASVEAYRTMKQVVSHSFAWNEQLGCYSAFHTEVPDASTNDSVVVQEVL
jgi:hypothetical protein